jgi:hypothetical protein
MPASAKRSVYLIETYWLPRTPFCLSSGDSRGVDFLSPLRDEREDLSSEVALQGANGVELGMPFGKSASDVILGPLVGAQAADGDDVQRAVCGAISAAVESMPDGLSG